MIYPYPNGICEIGDSFHKARVFVQCGTGVDPELAEMLRYQLRERFGDIVADGPADALCVTFAVDPTLQGEAYCLHIDGAATISAGSPRGHVNGAMSLLQAMQPDAGGIACPRLTVRDEPHMALRGVHLYTPGRAQLPFVRRLIDLLAALKYNTIFLEVGAGMEFKRHPEINRAWEEFVREASEFPGGPESEGGLQGAMGFDKNSLHTEVGGGSWITQDEMRSLVAHARRYHIEVIPEVQSLSHSYWLLQAHKELAERAEDPWPDTYCPSNPATYELLFDVLDEIISVFAPKRIHMGHDEVYSLGLCPRCRGKDGAELLAGDIKRIHDYLSSRGIGMMIWSDKLVCVPGKAGKPRYGGIEFHRWDGVHNQSYIRPATRAAADLIPKDITCIDWYWKLSPYHPMTEEQLLSKGFSVIFGNADADIPNLYYRSRLAGLFGAEISTWCAPDEYSLARNGKISAIIRFALATWWKGFDERGPAISRTEARRLLPAARDYLRGKQAPSRAVGDKKCTPLDLGRAWRLPPPPGFAALAENRAAIEDGLTPLRLSESDQRFSAVVSWNEVPGIVGVRVDMKLDSLVFLHGFTQRRVLVQTYRNLKADDDTVGFYRFVFADGQRVVVPLRYGLNISGPGGHTGSPNGYYMDERCRLTPAAADSAAGISDEVTVYTWEWTNPRPDTELAYFDVVLRPGVTDGNIALWAVTAVAL